VNYTIDCFKKVREKLESGAYKAEKIASWA